VAFTVASCVLPLACATAVNGPDGDGGSGGDGGDDASSSTGQSGPCIYAEDCVGLSDTCNVGTCINGKCAKTPANDGVLCDDGKSCSQNDICQAGKCTGTLKYCPSMGSCQLGLCDVETDTCIQVPGNDGQPCVDEDPCTQTGVCKSGACSPGKPTDCSFLNSPCTVGYCQAGMGCMSMPQNDGSKCDDGFFCTVNDTCLGGKCEGQPNTCAAPGDVCLIGTCNEVKDTCVAVPGNNGAMCDDTSACTTGETCSNGTCGGGAPANNGGACDDKSACTTNDTCQSGVCAGTPVAACQGGDGCCPQGCDVLADADCGGTIFMTSAIGNFGFYSYEIGTNTWTQRTPPPSVTFSQLTTDGTNVILLGADGYIYGYSPAADVWSMIGKGPGMISSVPFGFFKWTPNGYYYLKDGDFGIQYSNGFMGWVSIFLNAPGSSAGTYDPASGNLYIRMYGSASVMVFNTNANALTATWMSPVSVSESSRAGSFFGGFFYAWDSFGSIQKMDMANGFQTSTNVTPSENYTASDVDLQTGNIYIAPFDPTGTAFQVYNASTNSLSNLADSPPMFMNYATIVLIK
jgi:hypothetical protein